MSCRGLENFVLICLMHSLSTSKSQTTWNPIWCNLEKYHRCLS